MLSRATEYETRDEIFFVVAGKANGLSPHVLLLPPVALPPSLVTISLCFSRCYDRITPFILKITEANFRKDLMNLI